METQVEAIKRNPKKEYSLTDIEQLGVFPWARSNKSLVKLVKGDMFGENILEVRIAGEGSHQRYAIKGANIIKFLNKYGPALIGTVRTKRICHTKNCQKRKK